MINLKIDPEFQSQIPPLTDDEFKQLEENILKAGKLLSPLIVWNNTLVDGHNRYAILQKHPEIYFSTMPLRFANREEALAWICKNQLGRRNLTPEQKKYLIGKQYEAEKCANGGDRKSPVAKSGYGKRNLIGAPKTCYKVAAESGVGRTYVIEAEHYAKGLDAAEEAVPGTRQKVLSGEVKPTASEIASVARAPPEKRPALVAEICKPKKPKPQKPTTPKQKNPPAVAAPLPDASTSDEEVSDEESTYAPAPSEPVFPQKENEPLKVDRQQILEIANNRYHAKQLADGAAMLCEVSGAVNAMIRRWESVFRDYPDILTNTENRNAVKRNIQKVKDYLQKLEDTL